MKEYSASLVIKETQESKPANKNRDTNFHPSGWKQRVRQYCDFQV